MADASTSAARRAVLLTASDELHLKSPRTRRRLDRMLDANIREAIERDAPGATLAGGPRGRLAVHHPTDEGLAAAMDAASRVFGVHRAELTSRVRVESLDELVDVVAERCAASVAGRRFAVRVRRRGSQPWSTMDAERAIGARLLPGAAGVDLGHPDVTVRVHVWGEEAHLIEQHAEGPGGLPIGSQAPVLSLVSGGFDSSVATWMAMRWGSPVDLLHVELECAQRDHALAVSYELWRRWGAGSVPRVWVVDFAEIREALLRHIDDGHRQVVLKQLMLAAASLVAREERLAALVTGESVGQVSTQTVENLVQIDRAHEHTVLRPLAGLTKTEIVARAHAIGTGELSARAREVCDLSVGPVETAARPGRLRRAAAALPVDLVSRAVAARRVLPLSAWHPGAEPQDRHVRSGSAQAGS